MTIHEGIKTVAKQLETIYDNGEALTIATWVIEYVSGFDKSLPAQSKSIPISQDHEDKIHFIVTRLLKHEPVQYVLEETWFCGMKFFVNRNVLIPRPETEELVELVTTDITTDYPDSSLDNRVRILDIGSGSGCIPVVLKKRIPEAELWSVDISADALEVANQNAELKNTDIRFIEMDFLESKSWDQLPLFDIIVSNPPYITMKEKPAMRPNVIEYEPASALFVPDNDPLVFYKAIAEFGKTHLNTGGKIYCEINESLGEESKNVFNSTGYQSEILKDLQGKDRFIKSLNH